MPKLYTVNEMSLSIGASENVVRRCIKSLQIPAKSVNKNKRLYTYSDLKKLYKSIIGVSKPKITIDLGKPEDYIPLCFQNMESDEELLKHIEATEKRIAERRARLALANSK